MTDNLIKGSPEAQQALAEAAHTFRAAAQPMAQATFGMGFLKEPDLFTTNMAAQALFNEVVTRNAGDPTEIVAGYVNVLAMVIAQQVEPREAADQIIARLLTQAAALRARHMTLQAELEGGAEPPEAKH